MATVPSPRTWVIGDLVSAARLNTEISTAINFLLNPPLCDLAVNGTITTASGSATLITYDTEVTDTDNMHNSTNPSRIIFTTGGRYDLSFYNTLSTTTGVTNLTVKIALNAAGSSTGGTSLRTFDFTAYAGATAARETIASLTRVFNAGDYVECFLTQTGGGAMNMNTNNGVFATGAQARFVSLT